MQIGKDKQDIAYEFDLPKKAWFPRITESLLVLQQSAYKLDGVDESVFRFLTKRSRF